MTALEKHYRIFSLFFLSIVSNVAAKKKPRGMRPARNTNAARHFVYLFVRRALKQLRHNVL